MEKKILIVDDEQDVLDMIVKKMIADAQGKYYPLIARDGYEALDLLKKYSMAAVILDINMRNLDGLSVCQEMLKNGWLKVVPIIISSGHLTEENQTQLAAMGIKHFLKKPYSMNNLLDLLNKVVK